MLNEERKNDIIYLTIYLKKLIDRDFDNRLSEYGLTGQQGRIMFFVSRHEGVHQNDIENEFHLSKSTVSGLVKRMQKKEIINIEKQHPYAVITISDKGKDIIKHLREKREESIKHLTGGLDENNKQELCRYLIKLIENIEGGNH